MLPRRHWRPGNPRSGTLLLGFRPRLGIPYSSFAFDLGSTFAPSLCPRPRFDFCALALPSILGCPRFRLCPQILNFINWQHISSGRWRICIRHIFYSLDGQPIFAPPRPPWGKNRSPNLPISFPGIVGVYVPRFGDLEIVVWPTNENSHSYKHTIVLL